MKEYQEFQDKWREEIKKKMKLSGEVLELRHVEEKLIKLKKFEEAENVKAKADAMEEHERSVLEKKLKKYITKKEK